MYLPSQMQPRSIAYEIDNISNMVSIQINSEIVRYAYEPGKEEQVQTEWRWTC